MLWEAGARLGTVNSSVREYFRLIYGTHPLALKSVRETVGCHRETDVILSLESSSILQNKQKLTFEAKSMTNSGPSLYHCGRMFEQSGANCARFSVCAKIHSLYVQGVFFRKCSLPTDLGVSKLSSIRACPLYASPQSSIHHGEKPENH